MATELISLGILFLCAILGGIIATKFKQPAVFGLLLVGAIIGPSALNLVQDIDMIRVMAEFGAILILFIIGLEFDLSKLMKLGARTIVIGIMKFAIVLFFGYEITLFLGYSPIVALFVGVLLSFSSTVVIVKVLEQKEMFRREEVPLLIAILIIEDILAVLALTFFSGIKDTGIGLISTFERILFSIAILILAYFVMMKILRFGVSIILKNNNDESVMTFLSLGIGALFSYFAFYLGLTPSAGAFLAGSLIASLPNSKEYGKAVHPYSLIFTSIFFISMGTLVDFKAIKPNLVLIGVLILIVIITRLIAVGFFTYLLANFRGEQPFFASITMMSIGEFSLLVAKASEKFALGIDLVTITAAIIFITAILMSFGVNYTEEIYRGTKRLIPIKIKLRLDKLSTYMRKFFDQLEIENFYTKKLKLKSKVAIILIILALFASLVLKNISSLIKLNFSTPILYGFYLVSAALILFLLNLVYKRLKEVHHTLSVILTNVDYSRNVKKCKTILNHLLLAVLLFISAMLFPFAMFAFNLNIWANIIPFILVVGSFFFIIRLKNIIEGNFNYTPRLKSGISFAKI
jgi:CPA2 family monovalent cation:H+ antiporter-2|tara:strand:+ start:187 stop:1914 length:1728 start_codon:yes stop_codon:yes gene_type:complete